MGKWSQANAFVTVKTIQTHLRHAFSALVGLQVLATAFMTIPQCGGFRETLASLLGLSAPLLWIPVSLLFVASYFGAQKLLAKTIATPIETLAKNARDGETTGFAFQSRSRLEEEEALKRFVETQSKIASDIEGRFSGLEKSLSTSQEAVTYLESLSERQAKEISQFEQSDHDLRVKNQSMAAEIEVLQATLDSERRAKVSREVKMRAHEIYLQMERAVAKAAAQAIWIPNLMERLKAPTDQINELARDLESNWTSASFDSIGEHIATIREHSDRQLSMLEKLTPEELLAAVPEATEILEAGDVEIGDSAKDAPLPSIDRPRIQEPAPCKSEAAEAVYAAIQTESEQPVDVEEPSIEESRPTELSLQSKDPAESELASLAEDEAEAETIVEEPAAIIESEAIAIPASNDSSTPIGEAETLGALQSLVFELVQDYSEEVENVRIDADFQDPIDDVEVDEELLESVLSNLIEIAIYQWKEGSVRLRVSRKDDYISFAVDSEGKPLDYGEFDETQTNRIESALDRKIDVDMPSENELRMRYKYVPEEN